MRRSGSWNSQTAGLAASLLALGGVMAPAGAENVFNTASITADSLKMSVSSCEQVWGSGSLASCGSSTGDAEFVLGTGIRGAVFSLANSSAETAGGDLFTNAAGSAQSGQLTFTLAVTATASIPVNFAELSVTSTGTLGTGGSLTVTETGFPTGFSNSGTLSVTGAAGTTPSGSPTITDAANITSPFDIAYDIDLVEGSGGTLKLTSVESIFRPAPEPISLSLFGVGLAGLGFVRRGRRDKGGMQG